MKRKYLIQIILLLLLTILSISIFNYYYEKDSPVKKDKKNEEKSFSDSKTLSNQQNLIEDIKYRATNTNGDIYEILADYGEANLENPELMFLTNVKSKIIFNNTEKKNINLTSNFANFNTKTFETTFVKNVEIVRQNETITGDELYIVLDVDEENTQNDLGKEQNILRMSNNVLLQKPGYEMKADILEIDLITKNLKIYMNNTNNKVLIKSNFK
tara:strand:- start:244 stop:885 length:642 start_codon:yes stop_codon:yes gene_type:complete